MNPQAGLILLIPTLGLVSICRGGKWDWRVVPSSELINGLFWFGWTSTLVAGVLSLFSIV